MIKGANFYPRRVPQRVQKFSCKSRRLPQEPQKEGAGAGAGGVLAAGGGISVPQALQNLSFGIAPSPQAGQVQLVCMNRLNRAPSPVPAASTG
jgi:hypothetical protein